MYASNEDEYSREDEDWVFLRQTPPTNTVLHGAVNLVDDEKIKSTSSSSRSSSTSSSSSSSKSKRSDSSSSSSSSLSSIEHEHIQNAEQNNHLSNDDPVFPSHSLYDNIESTSTNEIKDEVSPSETIIKQNHENETTPVINEYDLLNNGIDLSNESIESTTDLRRRTGANVQEPVEQYSLTAEYERSPSRMYYYYRPRRNKAIIGYGVLVLLFVLQIMSGRVISSQRSTINKFTEELEKTNQRLDEIKSISIENIEQKLTKQFEEKFQKLINQKMLEFDQEKLSFVLQINELYHKIDLTQENFTNMIHQLTNENHQLEEKVTVLEHRLQTEKEQSSKEKEKDDCPEGINCMKSSLPTLDVLLSNLIKQTATIAEDTSVNLSSVLEQLSASFSEFIDHGQEYVEESKRKLNDLAGSQAAEQVQTTLRRGVENLSSSLRKAQSTYVTWLRQRAEQREQARMHNAEHKKEETEEKSKRRPWRWTFQRSHDRQQMRQQPTVTKKHSSNKEHVCHSKCEFPVKHICTMKNWMEKLFQP